MSSEYADLSRAELTELVFDLQERVEALETNDTPNGSADAGLDHRDRNVLSFMRENGRRSKRELVRLYITHTDIQNRKTAKTRAKALEKHPEYKDLNNERPS